MHAMQAVTVEPVKDPKRRPFAWQKNKYTRFESEKLVLFDMLSNTRKKYANYE